MVKVLAVASQVRVDAVQAGADEYLTKPFRPREVRAKITAMMRRPRNTVADPSGGVPQPEPAGPVNGAASMLRCNGLELDYSRLTAPVQGTMLELTRSEFKLLH